MAWNWNKKDASKLIRRKPVAQSESAGETSDELKALADAYISRGFTRQKAYARARKELGKYRQDKGPP